MRLYLSSYGLGNRPDEFVGLLRGKKRVAIVLNAERTEEIVTAVRLPWNAR